MTEATSTSTDRSTATALIYDWRPGLQVQRVPTEADTLSLPQLALQCGIGETHLLDLVEHGVLDPVVGDAPSWRFSADCIANLRRADRLRQDLALDEHGFALAMMCLDRISGLEAGLHRLRSELRQLGRHG